MFTKKTDLCYFIYGSVQTFPLFLLKLNFLKNFFVWNGISVVSFYPFLHY